LHLVQSRPRHICLVKLLSAAHKLWTPKGKSVSKATFITALARSITCGEWSKESIKQRLTFALSPSTLDTERLASSIHKKTKKLKNIENTHVENAMRETKFLNEWLEKQTSLPRVMRINLQPSVMNKNTSPFQISNIPEITTHYGLARWLSLTENDLSWMADTHNLHAQTKNFKLQHYHYKWLTRKSAPPRLLETPKSCLKSVQRKILHDLIDKITPHNAAHGFTKNRSCKTHAQIHCEQDIILHMDLSNFFTTITYGQVYWFFLSLGYPKKIARTLASLCTNTPSPYLLGRNFQKLSWQNQKIITQAHLPQGAPTSPALANLVCYKLDNRLEGLSTSLGINYSRYADDLAFSSNNSSLKKSAHFRKMVEQIADDQGFQINHNKTYTSTKSQQQSLVGIVVNKQPNIRRDDYDQIKAILHNCIKKGASSQNIGKHKNFKEHLRGKIAYIASINPSKAQKLKKEYQKINWNK